MTQAEKKKVIERIIRYVHKDMANDFSGHDYWHAWRVWCLAKHLCRHEKADRFVVEIAALLHDCADWKFNDGDLEAGPREAKRLLRKLGVDGNRIEHVYYIIGHISFKGEGVKPEKLDTIEAQIVQDADRLDSIGAIGAARTFAYGGSLKRQIYDPEKKPAHFQNFAQYKNNHSSSINNFYEKLILMKGLMNTKEAKRLAVHRHRFIERFLQEFMDEWNLKI